MIGRFSQTGVYKELLKSSDTKRVAIAGGLALAGYIVDSGSETHSTIGLGMILASLALNGIPIIAGAIRGLLKWQVNVDELVSIAIIACIIEGEFLTGAVVSFVMVLGALIEEATSESARNAIQSLMNLSPETATVVRDCESVEVAITEVKPGDLILIKPGERVPVDALVESGTTNVDESSVTGEHIPVEKTLGDNIFAGTLNIHGVIEARATKVGSDTTLGKVIQLVSEAEAHKPEAVRLIDRYAKWFTPTILSIALAVWLITGDSGRGITILIVGCPCALILAAPTAVVASIGRAAKAGILIKGGIHLETAGRADAVLFDKTGTITQGRPIVDRVIPYDGHTRAEILRDAGSVEQNSTHPFAGAILRAAEEENLELPRAENMITEIGLGVRGTVSGRQVEIGSPAFAGGASELTEEMNVHLEDIRSSGATGLVLTVDETPVGLISVTDKVKEGAKEAISLIKYLGIKRLGLLSGDHEQSVSAVAQAAGIKDATSGLKPADKLDVIKNIRELKEIVMFVGDGINDAPALAAANVGIAMGAAGTDVALETADIALMDDDIGKIPMLIDLSRRTLLIIKINIVFGVIFNVIAVWFSGTGYLSPIMGAVVHNIGSVLVVLVSASLAFYTPSFSRKENQTAQAV